MNLFISNFYLFFLALVFALLEIQIEGENGWAKNLPTWRPQPNSWYEKIFKKIMGGKELTGYHLVMFSLVFFVLHLPFSRGVSWSWIAEWETISLYFLFAALWDYLWFVFNPFYSLNKFNREHIWWHKMWLGKMPVDYYWAIFISFIFYLPVYYKIGNFSWWYNTVIFFLAGVLILTIFEYFYEKITGKTFPFGK